MKNDTKILLLGNGGREHALAWKMAQSSILSELYIAPGNAGTKQIGKNIAIKVNDFEAIKTFVLKNDIDTVVVGPELPLVEGIYDFFKNDPQLAEVSVIGPSKEAARLEGSKDFAKEFMFRHNIPTAKYNTFTKDNLQSGINFLESLKPPYVLKADGLAAGKGVLIIDNLAEAKKEFTEMLVESKFGSASNKVVIEQYLKGIEMSVFVLTDGDSYKILPEAKDYKRIGDKDQGLNTGGMGAVSPVPFADNIFLEKVESQVIKPTIQGLKDDKLDYKGFIFIGLMNVKGEPYVIEYNCRLGDPETEVIIPRIKSDILELFEGVATQTLSERDILIDERSAATVMMVSGGYPEKYETGKQIYGLNAPNNSLIFHAGTKSDGPAVLTAGGRVLSVTSIGKTLSEAVAKSYQTIENITFEGAYFRKDIGEDVIID